VIASGYGLLCTGVKTTVLLDITPCSPVAFYLRFRRRYCFHLQDRRINHASNKQGLCASCLLGLLFDREDGDSTFLRNSSELLHDFMALHFNELSFLNMTSATFNLYYILLIDFNI
jgi:hypothetical protein